jgi:hypothetical protein
VAISNRGLRGCLGFGRGKTIASCIREIRVIRGSIPLLVAVGCCFQFASLAKAQSLATSPDGSSTPTATEAVALHTSSNSIDGIDCITAYEADEEPLQICEDSSDPWNDLDEISLPANDRAVLPSRNDHLFSSFILLPSTFPLTLHQPGIIPAFLLPTHFSSSLREHIRERAPPTLA